jgi:hypothetical protein
MLSLVQLVLLILPFILLLPMTTSAFLQEAAARALQIRVAVLLLFANGALTIGIASAAFPVLREYGYRMALWLPAMSVIWFALQAVDNAHILNMLSLSQRYVEGGGSNPELFGALGELARSSRRWAHYAALLAIEGWFFAFYGLLFRSRLLPRPLAAFGMIMVLLHAAGITLPAFTGVAGVPALAVSLLVSQLALAGWLVAQGFRVTKSVAG